jgi:hypothetical protein
MTISMQLNEQFCLILSLKFTGKPWKSKKSFLSGHKWESVNTKVTQNFRSLVINKLAAQYLYNIHTLTILFSTILGRVCDVLSKTGGTSENWQNGQDQRVLTNQWELTKLARPCICTRLVFILCGTFWMKKNPSLVSIYGSVESYRFIRRKKTVGVNFRILSERSLQLK